MNIILFPVFKDLHWTLVVIDVNRKRVWYFDSLSGPIGVGHPHMADNGGHFMRIAMLWYYNAVRDEAAQAGASAVGAMAASSTEQTKAIQWACRVVNSPQQTDKCSCAVFACINAEHAARGHVNTIARFHMSQIPFWRYRMIWCILEELKKQEANKQKKKREK